MKDIAQFEESIGKKFRPWFIKDIRLNEESDCLRSLLTRHSKLLCIMNHGGFYGPWAAALAFHYLLLTHGGQGRKPTGVAWRGFYSLPIHKQITQYLTQLDRPLDYPGFKELLLNQTFNDLIILPEGTNCHYFDGKTLQPFVSPRFIELSIETQTPLLLFVHQGSEHWSQTVHLPKALIPMTRLLPKRYRDGIEQNRLINIPHMLKGCIPQMNVMCKIYQPSIHPSALRDKPFAKELIELEARKIRSMMQTHYDSLLTQATAGEYSDHSSRVNEEVVTHPCVEVA
ncbi:hypothetical protein [Litoribrevibacter albus]|uniref:Uncharacterized protein n=1 Tax=Litoribrevibacter albus TaxID=1473156 RepID=A0AA37SB27_9GAMM|nr:hypothetical protein [Litoribrevibacter albus]GLQ31263.1 hypothetical protein GCM10007876_17420 [Litoribrevibacter albus]